jgi:hypothetical protein
LVSLLALGVLALAAPSTAAAKVRLGPDLTPAPNGNAFGCPPPATTYPFCSWVNMQSTNPEAPFAAPSAGVITKWRFRAGCCLEKQTEPRTMTLETFLPGPPEGGYETIVPVHTGPSFVIPAGSQVISDPAVELPARVPIAAGERVGIVADAPIEFASYAASGVTSLIVAKGFNYGYPVGAALAFNVDVEPDADGDGYGDETQDCQAADPSQHGTECLPPPLPPPPGTLIAGKQGPCEGICGGGGVTFGAAPHPIPGPRGDGGIEIVLECPPGSTAPCGGILYAELPPSKHLRAVSSRAAGGTILAKSKYAIAPGKKKSIKLGFSKKTQKFLAQKRTRRVTVTVVPDGGQPVSTTKTLRYPAPRAHG